MLHQKRAKLFLAVACIASFGISLISCNSSTNAPSGGGGVVVGDSVSSTDPGNNPLGTLNGIAIGIGAHVYKIGNASSPIPYGINGKRWLEVLNTGTTADTTSLNGAFPTTVDLFVKLAAPGGHTCATGDSLTVSMNSYTAAGQAWAGVFTATACSLQVDYISNFGGMSGQIVSATLKNPGGKTISVKNAQFRVYQHYGKTGTPPTLAADATLKASMVIDSGTFELPAGRYFRLDTSAATSSTPGSSIGFGAILNDGTLAKDRLNLYIISLPNQVGTWQCGQSFSGGHTGMEVYLGAYGPDEHIYLGELLNGAVVGSCTINVLSQPTNNTSTGNYTATLIVKANNDTAFTTVAQRTIKIHGEFRH